MKISSIALVFFLALWVTHQPGVLAEISPETHKICSDTKDYLGCVNAHGQPPQAPDGKRRWERDDGDIVTFDPKSVKAINMNGGFGRYLI